MTITELINSLLHFKEKYGDIEVKIESSGGEYSEQTITDVREVLCTKIPILCIY